MRTRQARSSGVSISHFTTVSALGVLGWLLLTLLPVREAAGQGTVIFANQIPGGPGVGSTVHVWGPSATNPSLYLIGLGLIDDPSGTTPFEASGMSLIGASGSGGSFGYAITFAQLLGAVGSNQPWYVLFPVGQATTFRSGAMLGSVVPITETLTGNPGIPKDAAAATFMIVAWDNSSGMYPTWAEAAVGWLKLQIAAGWSAPFTVTAIGGDTNSPPYLNNSRGGANGMTSFNLCWSLGWGEGPPVAATLAATDVTATSATLNGTITVKHLSTQIAAFQWGTNTYYGNLTPGTNSYYTDATWPLSASLTRLTPGTSYHFRALAAYDVGSVCGSDQTFTTPLPYALTINTGSGYWGAASSTLSYKETGGAGASGRSFVLLQTADPTAPLSAWTRVATNTSTPGSFPIPPVGTAAPKYYRIKSQ